MASRRSDGHAGCMTEAEFQAAVVDLARRLGWVVYHVPDSRRVTARGCPDLVMIHERQRRLIFAELKSAKGRLSEEQALWLRVLKTAGVEAYLWRPTDLGQVIPRCLSPAHRGVDRVRRSP